MANKSKWQFNIITTFANFGFTLDDCDDEAVDTAGETTGAGGSCDWLETGAMPRLVIGLMGALIAGRKAGGF